MIFFISLKLYTSVLFKISVHKLAERQLFTEEVRACFIGERNISLRSEVERFVQNDATAAIYSDIRLNRCEPFAGIALP